MAALFDAARALSVVIGREAEMADIRAALFAAGSGVRVVPLVGKGGLGKTRMLNDVRNELRRGAVTEGGVPVHAAEILDLEPVRLSTTLHFIGELVKALDPAPRKTAFPRFRREQLRYRDTLVYQSSYDQIQRVLRAAVEAFELDYAQLATTHRMVWLLDTGEKFDVPIPRDFDPAATALLQEAVEGDEQPSRVPLYTADWLHSIFAEPPPWLTNTTVLVAGRPEGTWRDVFADALKKSIPFPPFTRGQVPEYFAQLLRDLEAAEQASPSGEQYKIERLRPYAETEAGSVAWAYSGGEPIRLAMLANLIADSDPPPELLAKSWTDVSARLGLEGEESLADKAALEEVQSTIEQQFLDMLLNNLEDLRAGVLYQLVRARLPLDAWVLEHVLQRKMDGGPNVIERELEALKDISLFKSRAQEQDGERRMEVWLHDVVYEIVSGYYAGVPADARAPETEDRVEFGKAVLEIINRRIEQCVGELRDRWLEERRDIEEEMTSLPQGLAPLRALDLRFDVESFRPLARPHLQTRAELRDELEELLLDRLYYELRLDPYTAFNDLYCELTDGAWLERDEDFMTQVEFQLWRLLRDEEAQSFVEGATPELWERLRRVALQDHALRWLQRLHLRERYAQVETMVATIRDYARRLQEADPTTKDATSWNHHFTVEEEVIHTSYAQVYSGQATEAAERLTECVACLQRVLYPGHEGEEPFVDENGNPIHPAVNRVNRAIGMANWVLGYAHAQAGKFGASQAAYNAALPYLRLTRFKPLQAYCQFNMARALAEHGYTGQATKNCEDVLNLLTEEGKGSTLPYAYAANTLALVRNAERAPDKAWPHAAVAHACFERMGEERGKAMAELQMGEALRRLADTYDRQPYLPDRTTPRRMYERSERILKKAYELITTDPILGQEQTRRIEAAIEYASSLRDQVRVFDLDKKEDWQGARRVLNEARSLLTEAKEAAQAIKHPPLQLDVEWSLATLLYRAHSTKLQRMDVPELARAFEAVAQTAFDLGIVKEFSRVRIGAAEEPGFSPAAAPLLRLGAEASEPRAVRRLGRIYGRLGRIYAEEFEERSREIRDARFPKNVPISEKDRLTVHQEILASASDELQRMAEYYVLALGYAQLFNPESKLTNYLRSDLHDRVKGFNDVIMQQFRTHLEAAYNRCNIAPVTAGDDSVVEWFRRSFGY